MKRQGSFILLTITAVFTAFLTGVFLGRSTPHGDTLSKNDQNTYNTDAFFTGAAADTRPYINGKININAASAQDLSLLPGIGAGLANAIIEYREQNGPFSSIMELSKVKGIGDAKITDIMDYITVGG